MAQSLGDFMKRIQGALLGNIGKKARPTNSITGWAAGGQNHAGKMTPKQQKLMTSYLRHLDKNRKQ